VGTDRNINPSLNFPVEPMICVPAATAVHSVGYGRLQDCRARGFMIDRMAIRLSAVLVAAGFIFYVVVSMWLWACFMPADRPTTIQWYLPYTPVAPAGQLCISANSLAWR
jgi:hypothetical protein